MSWRFQPDLAMVAACSGPSTTAQCPAETALLLQIVLMAEQTLSSIPGASLAKWLVMLCGGLGGQHEDGGILRAIAFLHVVGRKRARFLVLRDAVGVLAWMAKRAL